MQTRANILSEQQQQYPIVVDLDELPDDQHQPGMTVISNDVIEGTTHRHYHLNKKNGIQSLVSMLGSIAHQQKR